MTKAVKEEKGKVPKSSQRQKEEIFAKEGAVASWRTQKICKKKT